MTLLGHRDPRRTATSVLPDGHEARVLEPSPPAVNEPPFFADDPVDPAGATLTVVSPVGSGDRTWIDVVAADPTLAEFASERWLGPYRTLAPLPPDFARTRHALARLALHVVYRVRRQANGKYGLRWTLGGFGTPFFGDDEQVRVRSGHLVHQRGGAVRVAPIGSLRAAGEFVGVPVDPDFDHGFNDVLDLGDPDEDLAIDAASAALLGEWFGFVTSVLEELRHEHRDAAPSRVQLWPEHFDLSLDVAHGPGPGDRVNLGGSPGDPGPDGVVTSRPYLYVGPWGSERPGDAAFWNQPFGAILPYDDLVGAGDGDQQRASALAFLRRGLEHMGVVSSG